MPVLTAQTLKNTVATELTFTALDGATDIMVIEKSQTQFLILRNDTGADVTVTMLGDEAASTFNCNGFGQNDVDPVEITVTANSYFTQYINTVGKILAGETTITNGTGLSAALVTA